MVSLLAAATEKVPGLEPLFLVLFAVVFGLIGVIALYIAWTTAWSDRWRNRSSASAPSRGR